MTSRRAPHALPQCSRKSATSALPPPVSIAVRAVWCTPMRKTRLSGIAAMAATVRPELTMVLLQPGASSTSAGSA